MAMRGWIVLLMLGAAASSGCRGLSWPSLWHPGPTQYQRYNAVVHDPYPDADAGHGPEALGTRPRDYDRPPSDSQRYPLKRGTSGPSGATW
jgi:hypothetical protein